MSLEALLESFRTTLSEGSPMSFPIAVLAGVVASGICPCTLPVGLGIAGLSSRSQSSATVNRSLPIALSFFLGIVVTLTVLGAVAGHIGVLLSESFGKYWALAMAVISLVAAVVAFYGPYMKVTQLEALRAPGVSGTLLYGAIFSLGTSAAPLLLLLSIAAAKASLWYGLILALAFGIGRGIPFLIVGLFAGSVAKLAQLSWLKKGIQIVSGLALLFVCYYYITVYINFV